MEWIIYFIASWILFVLLIDIKKIKINIWGGVLAVLLQLIFDTEAMNHKLYIINNPILELWGSSLFFILGPSFTIGVLIAQYQPENKVMRIANVLALTTLYTLMELLLVLRKAVVYLDWHWHDSIGVNFGIMIIISWFVIVILRKKDGVKL
ncbi:MAG TPA: hypothetical protein DCP90_06865 [Clostridiales bacterium]|nr:MAG: hypothetical protein A2Y22_02145 [Clostridiales bacterium GWD2_32_59]HAN10316.1 hypothetical protein [Clostridiales bacterium]